MNLLKFIFILSSCNDSPDYVYDYKDVLPEVSALEMLKYGADGGLPVKDEFDLKTVDRLRQQKINRDNLPSVEDPNRPVLQNRLLGILFVNY